MIPGLPVPPSPQPRSRGDLSHAKIYVLASDPESSQQAAEALNRAAGFLRGQVARELTSRSVPQLHFIYDQTIDHANRMESLIAEARAKDSDSEE